MTTLTYHQELVAANRRTRRSVLGSGAVHAIAFLLWMIVYQITPKPLALVEIEWIEPEPVVIATSAVESIVEPVVESEPVPTPPTPVEQRFERPEPVAQSEPEPQRPQALDDRLRRSLDAQSTKPDAAPVLSVARPTTPSTPRPAAVSTTAPVAKPEALARSAPQTKPGAPAPLERSTQATQAAPKLAQVSTPNVQSTAPDMAQVDENTARRQLEGALLVGPVADRPLRDQRMPVYPDWARREGVEASVTLTFTVAPDGTLRPNVVVQKTSGHIDFDRAAREALLQWRFVALPGANDQWGTITFNFRLRD